MRLLEHTNLLGWVGGTVIMGLSLFGCSAAPVNMECREIQTRVNFSNLSEDQERFALQELEECRSRLKQAEGRDSAFIDQTEKRFTPKDPLLDSLANPISDSL